MRTMTVFAISLALMVCACSRYDRATYVPSQGSYWVDPPLEEAMAASEATLTERFEAVYPVLKTEVCSPGESAGLASRLEGLCDLAPACLTRVSERSAAYTVRSHETVPPDQRLELLNLQAESLRHVETVLPPGLTSSEIEEVLRASCDDSPTPALVRGSAVADFYGQMGDSTACGLDWSYTDRAVDTLRSALLDAKSDPECGG